MKLSKAVSAAVLAAASIAGSGGAFASGNPVSAPSDLFIAIWNPTTSTSIVQDLGVTPYSTAAAAGNTSTYDNLTSGSSFSWTIDNNNLAADLGSGTYQYQIFALDNSQATAYYGNSAYLSLVNGATAPDPLNNELVNAGILDISNYITTNLQGSTTLVKGTGSTYWAGCPSGNGCTDSFTMNTLANIGGDAATNPLNLVLYTGGGTAAADSPTAQSVVSVVGNSTARGQFSISGDTLNYSLASASTVPLPAAGWLLISGLLGLVAVSRRRGAEAT